MGKPKMSLEPAAVAHRALMEQVPFFNCEAPAGEGRFWSMASRGGYMGGNKTGQAAALAYAKYLREAKRIGDRPIDLQCVVLDMLGNPRMPDARLGQLVAFLQDLTGMLSAVAAQWAELDEKSFSTLADEMKAGLAFSKKAWLHDLRSETARSGWETRRRNARTKGRATDRLSSQEARHGQA